MQGSEEIQPDGRQQPAGHAVGNVAGNAARNASGGDPEADGIDWLDAFHETLKRYTPRVREPRRLAVPPARTVTLRSTSCGSRLTLDALIVGGAVRELGWDVHTCSLGQATTAIVAEHVPGLRADELLRVHRQFAALLRTGSGSCEWRRLQVFAPACDLPHRHASALLPFRALEQLFAMAAGSAA